MAGVADESGDRPVLEQNGEMNFDDHQRHKANGHVNGFSHVSNHVDDVKTDNHNGEIKADVKKEHKHSGDHKHHSSSSKHKSSHSDKHRHSSSHKSSHSDKHRSSSDKHKHHSSSSDKHKSSSSKDKDKHHSSSSHSKDKHSSSSSSSKHHSSSSKDKPHSSSSTKVSSSSGDKSRHSDEKSRHTSSDKHKHSSDKHKHSDKHEKSKHDQDKRSSDKLKHSSPDKHKKSEAKMETDDEKLQVKEEPMSPKVIKKEPQLMEESDDDIPLAARREAVKKEINIDMEDDSDDEPLAARMEKVKKVKTETPVSNQKVPKRKSMEDNDDYKPDAKKKKKEEKKKKGKVEKVEVVSPKKGRVKKEEPQEQKWKWWEETSQKEEGVKWNFLEHKGVVFAPDYERLPSDVKFYYNGAHVKLSDEAEEVAGFYAKMLEHDYTTRDVFNKNFLKDWRSVMTKQEKELITDLKKCNFKEMFRYFKDKQEERKSMSKDEKKKIKEQNEAVMKEFGYCTMDGHVEKMGNFKIEPPGLFRGRGDHPKQGCLKRRVQAEDIIINCSKDSKIPEPPPGHRWKKVQHDNSVTWLASWQENVQNQIKYVMLAATSKLKGEKDWNKYEIARKLHKIADRIRAQYREDWKSKEMRLRQRSVALYFIDKLALRAGNEKDEDSADTVGCCSLRYEHLKLHEEKNGKENVVEFDFLGKDSIRYHNEVSVEKRVFKNLQLFMENKSDGDDLFDRLNTTIMNKHLNTLMDGLTAKTFRTYNASRTLQEQLDLLTNADDSIPSKILAYNRANRAVAVLCNHQRSVSKNFGKQMENMQNKIAAKRDAIQDAKTELKQAKSDYKALKTEGKRKIVERKKKAVERLEDQLKKLEISMTDKDENKEIALGTSKLNYLDPRISVAWCKKWKVPLEKVYNKTQRDKFAWAIDMAEEDFKFTELEEGGDGSE